MSTADSEPTTRTEVPALRVDPTLRGRLRELAPAGCLVIDYYAGGRCGVTLGDLTVDVRNETPDERYAPIDVVEGVPCFAERRLLALLERAGPTLRLGGPFFARHLRIELDAPESWLDFLDSPGVRVGKRPRFRP